LILVLKIEFTEKRLHNQNKYLELQDLDLGYSPNRMLEIIKDRAKYLIERGSTLNNPHIPESYFKSWERIENNHAQNLRRQINNYLKTI
jgi:hypothetical protein